MKVSLPMIASAALAVGSLAGGWAQANECPVAPSAPTGECTVINERGILFDTICEGTDGDDEIICTSGTEDEGCSILGGLGTDMIIGSVGPDTIWGGEDDDLIFGLAGDDVIDSGMGDDIVDAGPGDDFVCGGDDDDNISGGDGHDDILGEAGEDVLVGLSGDDRICGGLDDDLIYGGLGDDELAGDEGKDRMSGGAGPYDVCYGDGSDTSRACQKESGSCEDVLVAQPIRVMERRATARSAR